MDVGDRAINGLVILKSCLGPVTRAQALSVQPLKAIAFKRTGEPCMVSTWQSCRLHTFFVPFLYSMFSISQLLLKDVGGLVSDRVAAIFLYHTSRGTKTNTYAGTESGVPDCRFPAVVPCYLYYGTLSFGDASIITTPPPRKQERTTTVFAIWSLSSVTSSSPLEYCLKK